MDEKVVIWDGYFKRSKRKGHPMKLAVHHLLNIVDSRGVKVEYAFAVRMDEAGRGQIDTYRTDGFLGPVTKLAIDETPMSTDGYYIIPEFGPNYAWTEKLEPGPDLEFALEKGAKPLANYVVKQTPATAPAAPFAAP